MVITGGFPQETGQEWDWVIPWVNDARIIKVSGVVFDERARLKCFACERYGRKATCPPFIPDIFFFQRVFRLYEAGILVCKSWTVEDKEEARYQSSLELHRIMLDLEREAFNHGFYFATAFIGGSCKWCKTCSDKCAYPLKGRIPLEAAGIDVVATCKKVGIEIKFPVKDTMNRVGLLLL